jgi:transposase
VSAAEDDRATRTAGAPPRASARGHGAHRGRQPDARAVARAWDRRAARPRAVRASVTGFADAEARLSPRLLDVLHRLRQRWLAIDVEIADATRELTAWADHSALCQRVVTVPIATATVAAVGNGRMFASGRDMAAWLGIVPSQHSGGKPTLGRISKRGNTYLRQLFIQGAQSSFLYLKRDQSALGAWLQQVEARRHRRAPPACLCDWSRLTAAVIRIGARAFHQGQEPRAPPVGRIH